MTAVATTVTHASDDESVISIVLDAIKTAVVTDADVSRLSVKRVDGGKVTQNCFNFSPLEIASIFDRVRTDHGVGMYEVWVLSDKKHIVKRISFTVDHSQHQGQGQQGQQGQQGEISQLKQMINDKFGQLNSKINNQNQHQHQHQKQPDMIQLIKFMQETQRYERESAKADFDARSTNNSTDFFAQAEKFGQMAESLGFVRPGEAERDDSDPWGLAKAAETLKPEIGDAISLLKIKAGQGQPAQQTEKQQEEKEGSVEQLQRRTLAHMHELASAASRGADPGLYADLTIDRFGDQIVSEWLGTPGLVDQLVAGFPPLLPHKIWLEKVFREIKLSYTDEDEENPATADYAADITERKQAERNAPVAPDITQPGA